MSKKSSDSRKIGLNFLIFCLISSEQSERAGKQQLMPKNLVLSKKNKFLFPFSEPNFLEKFNNFCKIFVSLRLF